MPNSRERNRIARENEMQEEIEILTNEKLAAEEKIKEMQDKSHKAEDEILGLQRKFAAFNKEKTVLITVPVTGEVQVTLEGPWVIADTHRVIKPLTRAVRLQKVAEHKKILSKLKQSFQTPPVEPITVEEKLPEPIDNQPDFEAMGNEELEQFVKGLSDEK